MLELSKVKFEFKMYRAAIRKGLAKRNWKNPIDWGHQFVDFFVELYRAMPYTLGHLCAFLLVGDLLWRVFG